MNTKGLQSNKDNTTLGLFLVFALLCSVVVVAVYSVTKDKKPYIDLDIKSVSKPHPNIVSDLALEVLRVNDAKTLIKDALKNKDSALFSGTRIGDLSVCGYVQSKNSFGAYGDPQGFIVFNKKEYMIEEQVKQQVFNDAWSNFCW